MKEPYIETIVRYVACGEDYIDVQTTTYFLGLPIMFKSKKYVPPIEDDEMAATYKMYKERVTLMNFR